MKKSTYLIIFGIGFLSMGLFQNYDTRCFNKYGAMAAATPYGESYEHVTVHKDRKDGAVVRSYNDVTLEFRTKDGEHVIVKKEITDDMLNALKRQGSLPIKYLSNNPNRTRLSNANTDDGIALMLFGGGLLGSGLLWRFLVNFFSRPSEHNRSNRHLRKPSRR